MICVSLYIVDGVWESWSDWTICTRTCGGGATHRNRTCTEPQYDGEDCHGEDAQLEDCNTQPCPSKFLYMLLFPQED